MSFKIGDIDIKENVVLAPMAGISNPSYMRILEEFGLGLAITELISSEAIVRDNKKTFLMLEGIEKLNMPVGVQLFGANPKSMADAAEIIVNKYPNVFIDINMGCPVPKVAIKNNAGSALLKNPELVKKIVTEVVNRIDRPVTVKIRSGWDSTSINAVEIAKIIEESGAKAISVHARTRAQGYSGKADWNIIKSVVENVNIPVIGNGDILTCFDAKRMLDETGCTAVMIGRGLLGNPWLVGDTINYLNDGKLPELVSVDEKIDMMKRHLENLVKDKGEVTAVLEMRGHFLSYIKGLPINKEIKNELCKCKSSKEVIKILDEYREKLNNMEEI